MTYVQYACIAGIINLLAELFHQCSILRELTQEYEEKYETLLVSDRSTKELQKAVKV